ncbi:hypothetical protein N7454_003230 [Penicillium verhagenii]|nr:hypothetical protein N7454_003230 [Penicillium verhagenii]
MTANPKRDTVLPDSLWRAVGGGTISPPAKVLDKNHTYRLGIPVIPDESQKALSRPTTGSLDRYKRSFNIDQAGPGVIALKDCFANLSEANIGECLLAKESSSTAVSKDIRDVGLIVIKLNDRGASLSNDIKEEDGPPLSRLARSFLHRTKTERYIEPLITQILAEHGA